MYNKVDFAIWMKYTASAYNDGVWDFTMFTILSDFMNPHYVDAYIILSE